MPLPSSGAISLLSIANEFGGSAPHSLNEYYGVASGIPSSGQISMNQFYGASAVVTQRSFSAGASFNNTSGTQTGYWNYSGFLGDAYGSYGNWSGAISRRVSYGAFGGISGFPYMVSSYVLNYGQSNESMSNSVPFPWGSSGGWYYYQKRGDTVQSSFSYDDGMDMSEVVEYHANRTTSSSYPH